MFSLRWLHHSKAVAFALVALALVGSLSGLAWMNQKGFEGEWGQRIAEELARLDIHAEFRTVHFSPTRGIIARDVVIYSDAERRETFAEIPRLRFEVDHGKALRGELQIRRVILHDARLTIPISSNRDHTLQFTELSGRASIDRQNRFTLEEARGKLAGMDFSLTVELDEFKLTSLSPKRAPADAARHDEFVSGFLGELTRWSFPPSHPPELDLRITGSMQRPDSIRTSFSIAANELHCRDYQMENVLFKGELHGPTLKVDHLRFSDGLGELDANASYNLHDRSGRYQLTSSVKIADFLRQALDNSALNNIASAHAPTVEAGGEFEHGADGFHLSVIGKLAWERFRFLGSPFEHFETEFSWRDGNLFLRDLVVTHEDGELSGRILIRDEEILYEANSSLPLSVYRAFLKENGGLDKALARTRFSDDSAALITAEGSINRNDLSDWVAKGHASFENFSYNDVPLASASASFDISPNHSVYEEVAAEFVYDDYKLRHRHGGPRHAVVSAREVRYDGEARLTHISRLRGTAWPAPVLRLFIPKSADYIEKHFGFHSPPKFDASGVIDINRPGTRTDVTTVMTANGTTDYKFLDRHLQLTRLSSKIRTRRHLHEISDLRLSTLGAAAEGAITVRERPGTAATYTGGIKWNDASLAAIGRKYDFEKPAHGHVTGRVDFSGTVGAIRSFNGRGVAGLRNGQLFLVPVFGPLSAPIGGVLGNKKFSHEQARDASATFVIRNGVVYTNDFLTSTPSTVFAGEGLVDLATSRLDLTVRMNARGLLGLVTLPLRPFNGLFQFRGQGPMKRPVWTNSAFTSPVQGRNHPIFRAPPRALIVRE